MNKKKPIWETNKNHITGYHIPSLNYEFTWGERKIDLKIRKNERKYNKTTD